MIAYVDDNGNLISIPQDPSKRREFNINDIEISTSKAENRDSLDQFVEGVVSYFNSEKGYGCIRQSKTKESVFVHHKQLAGPKKLMKKCVF